MRYSCPVVWIAERKDALLPLLAHAAIRGIMYRTVRSVDLRDCLFALRQGRRWTQPLELSDDDEAAQDQLWSLLTQKEQQLAALLVEGLKSKDIAVQLGTTPQVIKNRASLIYNKLGVNGRFDLLKVLLLSPPTCESASPVLQVSRQ